MNTSHARIAKDLMEVMKSNNPENPFIFAKAVNDNLDHVVALIIGPPETPYAYGFFQFDMRFPFTYPNTPPKTLLKTTDYNKVRFNPNLYSNGKVCLSILGTWSGESEDEWRSSYSITYVLQAIQSLIMNSTPYYNEPGFELKGKRSPAEDDVKGYSDKLTHETLRVAVLDTVDQALGSPDDHFSEIIKQQFLLFYHNYVASAKAELELHPKGTPFVGTPFEHNGNYCVGKYDYEELLQRFSDLRKSVNAETEERKVNGVALTKKESGSQYYKMLEAQDKFEKCEVEGLEGVSAGPRSGDNIYLWDVSLFGPEGTMWEGGMFSMEMVFMDEAEVPRMKFTTSMYHPHISEDGVPYVTYVPNERDPVIPVIKAVRALLSNRIHSSPSTWANIPAAKLYFSKDDEEKKLFKRNVGRCVRRSVEG
eukprot:TRINITY_DN4150_c0_g1_i1.p1 TRINITY_DN4150_c0_g1~~TRINITY_DN4150_c0_g1_i1.p1  ORF type:complete len:422 (+),score=91.97 TRINITY_DN4150_c0_g1_i1:196-1461(+)